MASCTPRCVWRIGFVTTLLLGSIACNDSPPPVAEADLTVGDSAAIGSEAVPIKVVDNTDAAWAPGQEWRLSRVPTASIGVQEGEEAYQLFRVSKALKLADGSIVVAAAGTSELRFFDEEGRYLQSAGSRGSGPGEFSLTSSLRFWQLPSGSLAVSDAGNGRVNIFSSTGEYLTTVAFDQTPEAPRVFLWGVFDDGSWLTMAPEGGGVARGAPGDVTHDEFLYLRFDDSGGFTEHLAQLASRPRYVHEYAGGVSYPYIPFTPEPKVVAAGEYLYQVDGPAPEIQKLDMHGTALELIRWPAAPRLTADIWEEFKEVVLGSIENEYRRETTRTFFDRELPLPEHVPATEVVRIDSAGNVWLGGWSFSGDEYRSWEVIAADGRWLGTVEIPAALEVHQIGADFVIGLQVDELGVERVVVHDLVKP